jgi:hypothetical protein
VQTTFDPWYIKPMDRTPIKEALEKARLIIASHGMISHMPSYIKSSLANPLNHLIEKISYEFYLDPLQPGYSMNNYNCALNVCYIPNNDEERDGGIYKDFNVRVSIRIGSADLRLQEILARENMISSLTLLGSMIESSIPKKITLMVMSPEDLKEKRKRTFEQQVAEQIFTVLGKESVRNLRKGGKPRHSRIPEKYSEVYGSMPEPGRYRYSQIRAHDRHGHVKNRVEFVFIVNKSFNDFYTLKAYRVA